MTKSTAGRRLEFAEWINEGNHYIKNKKERAYEFIISRVRKETAFPTVFPCPQPQIEPENLGYSSVLLLVDSTLKTA